MRFNQLLEKQAELMNQMSQSEASLTPLSNGSQTHSSKHAFQYVSSARSREELLLFTGN